METNDLKKLLNTECMVIDPRSKKKQFEPATIISVYWTGSLMSRQDKIYENISYNVKLHRITKTKKFREVFEYNRCFNVSNERIKLPVEYTTNNTSDGQLTIPYVSLSVCKYCGCENLYIAKSGIYCEHCLKKQTDC